MSKNKDNEEECLPIEGHPEIIESSEEADAASGGEQTETYNGYDDWVNQVPIGALETHI
ncbi:MAG: hypothetical protein K0T99_02155 [Alphaproteobacteria bacterium]|nr:hypothetical protein [Alphaproteobacteria bacterium]